jgi:hypothetical protein
MWMAMEDSEIAPIGLHTNFLRNISCVENDFSQAVSKIGEWRYDFFTKGIHRVDVQDNFYCDFCSAVATDEIRSVQNKHATIASPNSTIANNIVNNVEATTFDLKIKSIESAEAPAPKPTVTTTRPPVSIRLGRSNPSEKKSFISKKTSEINSSESKKVPQHLLDEHGNLAAYSSLHALILQHQKILDDNSTTEPIIEKTGRTECRIDDELKVCESFMQREIGEVELHLKANGNYASVSDFPFLGKNGEFKLPVLREMNAASSDMLGKEDNDFAFPQTAGGKQF